ncbi:MAG TPA: monovalent cation/H(+) antiporter subunit G [Thermomicrobiales bacterium]|nr:monovalent cation/H(+) antiporter subunit G [Thermomicrobiales bacterium]
MSAYIYDVFVVLGLLVMTLGVFGIIRMPDLYMKLHAASKTVVLGVMVLALTATALHEESVVARTILLCLILVVTTPVSSHAVGRAGFLLHERMSSPGAVDESGSHLGEDTPTWRL